jgi:quercetin dioxygenase-like cupin family protein
VSDDGPEAVFVREGTDRHELERGLGITRLRYKVATADTNGGLFVIEQTMLAKGGPPKHVHFEQDEWFFPVEGEFIAEVGKRQYRLRPGDSLLAPRLAPHAWAYVADAVGKIVIAFSPAGKMEAFFDLTALKGSMPSQDPQLWLDHGMKVLGPPLPVD